MNLEAIALLCVVVPGLFSCSVAIIVNVQREQMEGLSLVRVINHTFLHWLLNWHFLWGVAAAINLNLFSCQRIWTTHASATKLYAQRTGTLLAWGSDRWSMSLTGAFPLGTTKCLQLPSHPWAATIERLNVCLPRIRRGTKAGLRLTRTFSMSAMKCLQLPSHPWAATIERLNVCLPRIRRGTKAGLRLTRTFSMSVMKCLQLPSHPWAATIERLNVCLPRIRRGTKAGLRLTRTFSMSAMKCLQLPSHPWAATIERLNVCLPWIRRGTKAGLRRSSSITRVVNRVQ